MAKLPTNKRNDLPSSAFALPSQRKYPINDAAHVRNAAARLEQERAAGKISPSDYAKAKSRIVAAGKRFGVKSDQPSGSAKAKRIRVSADLGHGGSLSVRHMADRTISLDGVAVTLSDDGDDKPVWIQLAKPGTFRGHSAGPFELNAQTFDEIVRNFNGSQNHEIPIDFEHASEADATDGTIPTLGAPAQGWIREMKVENGNLWGLVYWGDRAREYIRAGQYKYFSPAIRFGSKDRVSGQPIGARMTSGALTNNPFLDGMKPLAAKDAAPESEAGTFVLSDSLEDVHMNLEAELTRRARANMCYSIGHQTAVALSHAGTFCLHTRVVLLGAPDFLHNTLPGGVFRCHSGDCSVGSLRPPG